MALSIFLSIVCWPVYFTDAFVRDHVWEPYFIVGKTRCLETCLFRLMMRYLLLMPLAPSGAWAINDPPPSHSVLGCSCDSGPVGPLLFQLCFSVSPPTVARPASLPFPLRVPGQGLACGAGCWLPEGVSDAAPLPPQYLLGHWFLSRSLNVLGVRRGVSLAASFRLSLHCVISFLDGDPSLPR